MEVDGEQQRLIYGDSVQDLPNLKVIAKRTRRSVVPPTANDAIVTNYGSDGKVLIIGDGNEFATGANPKGKFLSEDKLIVVRRLPHSFFVPQVALSSLTLGGKFTNSLAFESWRLVRVLSCDALGNDSSSSRELAEWHFDNGSAYGVFV